MESFFSNTSRSVREYFSNRESQCNRDINTYESQVRLIRILEIVSLTPDYYLLLLKFKIRIQTSVEFPYFSGRWDYSDNNNLRFVGDTSGYRAEELHQNDYW